MNEKDETRLKDMLDAAYRARKFIEGKTRFALEENEMMLGFAVVRALEIVGEASGVSVANDIEPVTGLLLAVAFGTEEPFDVGYVCCINCVGRRWQPGEVEC